MITRGVAKTALTLTEGWRRNQAAVGPGHSPPVNTRPICPAASMSAAGKKAA
jgi:hypothetical protein